MVDENKKIDRALLKHYKLLIKESEKNDKLKTHGLKEK